MVSRPVGEQGCHRDARGLVADGRIVSHDAMADFIASGKRNNRRRFEGRSVRGSESDKARCSVCLLPAMTGKSWLERCTSSAITYQGKDLA